MSDKYAIQVKSVTKSFRLPHEKRSSVKSIITSPFKRNTYEKQIALKGISFDVKQGEFFGIVGRNGSGKSTMLKLLAGIYTPDKGTVTVNGKLTPFIELGVGFNPELTGRENVFLNGALLGFNRKEMAAMYDDIVKFAELKRFMDQKLKNYSSGMQVRLAFAIAIQAKSQILLLDEVLAVGDANFQKKCFDYFKKLKKEKQTVVFVSHDMQAVREYCDRAVLIEGGEIIAEGKAEKVAQKYTRLFLEKSTSTSSDKVDETKRWGSKRIEVKSVTIKASEEQVVIQIKHAVREQTDEPIFGMSIFTPIGAKIFETNTRWKKIRTGSYEKGQSATVTWKIPNIFTNGENVVTVAVADSAGIEFYDWWDEAASFKIDKDMVTTAIAMPNHEVQINAKRS
ncbi:MAG TPA: ABC transporter ATP-binding protein [Candidatus Saccharibacteria bacterium]|jgi:ABC-2 type transport system ATP-binding protein|nr:ABC transporter ATP-binding protein [Candidatus Saccharibacteria bacterium]HMT56160.1 ABC transporter ATP-binding protein [Candidatus Saccharibacteria bacterium]